MESRVVVPIQLRRMDHTSSRIRGQNGQGIPYLHTMLLSNEYLCVRHFPYQQGPSQCKHHNPLTITSLAASKDEHVQSNLEYSTMHTTTTSRAPFTDIKGWFQAEQVLEDLIEGFRRKFRNYTFCCLRDGYRDGVGTFPPGILLNSILIATNCQF